MWDKSVKDLGFGVLSISQFTLYGRLQGNKPDFRGAMKTEQASAMYTQFLEQLRSQLPNVQGFLIYLLFAKLC